MTVLQLGPYPPPHGGVQTNLVGIHRFLQTQGIQCEVINLTRFRGSAGAGVYYPRNAFQVVLLLLRVRADIIHLHIGGNVTGRLLGLCLFCSLLPWAKTVLTLHSGGYPSSPEGRRARPRSFRGFVFRRLDGIIAVNSAIENLFHQYGVSKGRVRRMSPYVALPERLEASMPDSLRRFFQSHQPVLLSVGGLETEYDVPLQIEALGMIRDRFPGAGLVLVGSGSLKAETDDWIKNCPYGEHVLSCGDLPHSVTLRAIAESDVLLRATLYDGDSIAVREALGLGTPVVATDNSMRPDGVYLTPAKDAAAIVAAVGKALAGGSCTPGAVSAGQDNLESILRLYEELAGNRKTAVTG